MARRRRYKVVLQCGHWFLMYSETGRPPAARAFGCDCSLPLVDIESITEDRTYDPADDPDH